MNRFRYYGELLRPNLGNLHLTTLGIGMDCLKKSSIELIWHAYFQDQPMRSWRESALTARTGGRHSFLGQEWDLIMGLQEWERWELECVGSVFVAGNAYDKQAHRAALGLTLQLEYNF